MNINEAFPSNYIRASDLNGNAPVVTIREVKTEAVGRNKEVKPVLYFEGKTKGLVLNKTNAKKIAELVDSADTEDWPGNTIRLYPTETQFGDETVECIRIKSAAEQRAQTVKPAPERKPRAAAKPNGAEEHTGPVDDDSIPF